MNSYGKHIYEVDIIGTFLNVEKIILSSREKYLLTISKKEYIVRLKENMEYLLTDKGIDVPFVLEHKLPVVIKPQIDSQSYEYWLALHLMTIDEEVIPLVLLFHYDKWNRSLRFINLVEFIVFRIFQINKPFSLKKKASTILNWITLMRYKYGYSLSPNKQPNKEGGKTKNDDALNDEYKSNSEIKTYPIILPSNGGPEKENDQLDTLSQYNLSILEQGISIDKEIIKRLGKILIKKANDKKQLSVLISLLQGKSIENAIPFNCAGNTICDVFLRLKDVQKIVNTKSHIGKWIKKNFLFKNNKKGYISLTDSYIHQAMCGQKKPTRNSRIDISSLLTTAKEKK
ncbi:MAG: hypothetical protein HUU48_09205 [Flavobacteriales bacterium]|nr:hypothetical protein [Flavobacteriales bacterium]